VSGWKKKHSGSVRGLTKGSRMRRSRKQTLVRGGKGKKPVDVGRVGARSSSDIQVAKEEGMRRRGEIGSSRVRSKGLVSRSIWNELYGERGGLEIKQAALTHGRSETHATMEVRLFIITAREWGGGGGGWLDCDPGHGKRKKSRYSFYPHVGREI